MCENFWLQANSLAALRRVRETDAAASKVNFTVVYFPYQLYPGATQEGEDKYEWYKKSRYGDSEEKMKMYTTLMTAYGVSAGINCASIVYSPPRTIFFLGPPLAAQQSWAMAMGSLIINTDKFGGTVANTLQAHRIIQHFQETAGPTVTNALVNSLYRQYFEEEKHPSSKETLLTACKEAGIDATEAENVIDDESEGLVDVKMKIREQASNGVDSVPFVIIEGKRRDMTVQGANEVEDYVKALMQVVKESS